MIFRTRQNGALAHGYRENRPDGETPAPKQTSDRRRILPAPRAPGSRPGLNEIVHGKELKVPVLTN
jgi:hypothetical protein